MWIGISEVRIFFVFMSETLLKELRHDILSHFFNGLNYG